MPVIGTLTAEITASTTKFEEAALRVEQRVLSMAGSLEKNTKRVETAFENSLNPATALAAKIQVLEGLGKSAGDIFAVYAGKIESATAAAERNGQPIPALLKKYQDMAAAQTAAANAASDHAGKMDLIKSKLDGLLPAWAQGYTQFMNMHTAVIAATTAWVAFAANAISDTADFGDALDEMAQKTGLTVGQLSGLKLGLEQSGVTLDQFASAVKKLNANLDDARNGTGEAGKALIRLGIDISQINGPYDALKAVADVFELLPDSAEKTALAMDLFGKAGADMIPVLNSGSTGLQDMIDKSTALGLVLDESGTGAAARYCDAVDTLKAAWEGFKLAIGTSVLPVLADLLESITSNTELIALFQTSLVGLKLYLSELSPLADLRDYLKFIGIHAGEAKENVKDAGTAIQGVFDPANRTTESLQDLTAEKKNSAAASKELADLERQVKEQYDDIHRTLPFVTADTAKYIEQIRLANIDLKVHNLDLTDMAGLVTPMADRVYAMSDSWDDFAARSGGASKKIGEEFNSIFNDLGKGISDAILKWQGFWSSLADIAKQFAGGILRSIIQPLTGGIMNSITGLFNGQGGNFGANISGGLSKFFGSGAGSLGAKAFGLGVPGGGALGSAFGVGQAGLGWLGGLMTNPFTIAGAGAALGGYALYKYINNPNRKGSIEAQRDFGVAVSKDTFKDFWQELGISEEQMKGIRKDLESSPKFIQEILVPGAKAAGTLETLYQKLSAVQTVMGTFDFADAARKGVETGVWEDLNKQYAEAFGLSEALVDVMPDFAERLAAVGKTAAEVSEENLAKLNGRLRTSLDLFMQTGYMSGGFASKLRAAGVDDASILAQSGELRQATALQGEFGSLQSSIAAYLPQGAIPSLPFEAAQFLQSGAVTQSLRDKVSQMGGDISAFEKFSAVISSAQSREMELADYISQNADAQEAAAALYEELGGLQDTLARQIEEMTSKFTEAIDRLVAQLARMETPAAGSLPPAEVETDPSEPPPDDYGRGIPGLARGGRISRSGLAYVHSGETVGRGGITISPVINIQGGSASDERNVREIILPGIIRAIEGNYRGARERIALSIDAAQGAII